MLLNLHVKNLALIDEVEVYFKDHLNILTGETGAGKSIIIGSINAALGGKVSKEIIRKGADYALIELVFQIEDNNIIEEIKNLDIPIEEDGQVIVTKKIMNGRNISKINGENVTSAILKQVSGLLIDIHGQHEHQSLLYKSKHLEILDRFSKDFIGDLKEKLSSIYYEYIKTKEKLDESVMDEEKRLREISFLEFEVNEITQAKLIIGEDEDLSIRYKKLKNSNNIMEGLTEIYEKTGYNNNTSAGDSIGRTIKIISKIQDFDEEVLNFKLQLEEIDSLLNDFNRDISNYMANMNFDEEEFKIIEDRISLINNLKSKYGNSINNILEYKKRSEEKLQQLIEHDEYVDKLKAEVNLLEGKLKQISQELSNIRKKEAVELTKKIKEALIELNFLDVKFEMQFENLLKYSRNGFDEAEFIISTNPGEELKPLSKVASGGELSRIMLAIKSILADNDSIDTLIFDEIDVGISGRTAQKVSERLAVIAKNHQIICITHLAQIAAMADEHFIIEKTATMDSTVTSIRELNEIQVIDEIARILGGAKITDSILESAKEMKELAKSTKIY